MAKAKKTITITQEEYDNLVERSRWLECLENAGVDNWGGYDYARELQDEWDEENE